MISLARVATLAGNTVREAVRHRVLYVLVFFSLLLTNSSTSCPRSEAANPTPRMA